MHKEKSLFSFLESVSPTLAQLGLEIEKCLFDDPRVAIIKSRNFLEEVVELVFKQEEIDEPVRRKLYEKINYLFDEGYVPKENYSLFSNLRITGNRAVHNPTFNDLAEALQAFKSVFELGDWFAYNYGSPELKIPEFKYPTPPSSGQKDISESDISELVAAAVQKEMAKFKVDKENEGDRGETIDQQISYIDDELSVLEKGQSNLFFYLKKLRESSQEAVENASSFSKFKEYMHVERPIESDLIQVLKAHGESNKSKLILLCGNVGDGKSHLLAYLKQKHPDLMNPFKVHNDATESFDPEKNAIETLEELLAPFSDQNLNQSPQKLILAINLGVLNNFIDEQMESGRFQKLIDFISESRIFDPSNVTQKHESDNFILLGFGNYRTYELTEKGPQSTFFKDILSKITQKTQDNPFYYSYQKDVDAGIFHVLHRNYEFLMREDVQERLIQLLIEATIKDKISISARALYNFLSEILIPHDYSDEKEFTRSVHQYTEQLLPNLIFNKKGYSPILSAMYKLDPIHNRTQVVDQFAIDFYTSLKVENFYGKYLNNKEDLQWMKELFDEKVLIDGAKQVWLHSLIRTIYLISDEFFSKTRDYTYKSYMSFLYAYNKKDPVKLGQLYEDITKAIFYWNGSPKKDFIYLSKTRGEYKVAQHLHLNPKMPEFDAESEEPLQRFRETMELSFNNNMSLDDNTIKIEIDFSLFHLLQRVLKGYLPNKKDYEDAIQFVEFIDKALKIGNQREELLLCNPKKSKVFRLTKRLEQFRLEREEL